MFDSITYLNHTLINEWHVVWWGSRIDTKKTCIKDIGLCAQNMITILGLMVKIVVGNLYDHLMSTRIFDGLWIRHSYELQFFSRGKWLWP